MKHSEFFWEKGYLHLPGIFSEQEVHSLTEDLVWMMDSWAENTLVGAVPGARHTWMLRQIAEAN